MMQPPQSEQIITPEHKAVAPNTMVMAFAVEPLLRWILPSVNSDISSNPALLDSFSSVAFVVDRIICPLGFRLYWKACSHKTIC